MRLIKAKVKPVGKKTYRVVVEGLATSPQEKAEYKGEQLDPEITARQNAGAYVKGYNQAVDDVLDVITFWLADQRK